MAYFLSRAALLSVVVLAWGACADDFTPTTTNIDEALALGSVEEVRYWAGQDATRSARDAEGRTVLMSALMRRLPEALVIALIEGGSAVNALDQAGYTALIIAAETGASAEVVEALLDAGADVNAKAENGWTALMIAVEYGAIFEIFQALRDAGGVE